MFSINSVSRASRNCLAVFFMAGLSIGCSSQPPSSGAESSASDLLWQAFRIRSDDTAPLNADIGWAAAENSSAQLLYDQPFRLRVQVSANRVEPDGHVLRLQYRLPGSVWRPVGLAHFPYPDFATPMISVIRTDAYEHGEETVRLLGTSDIAWDDGFALNATAETPVWRATGEALEWEWPLVVRRFFDGPGFAENDTEIQLRVVDGYNRPLPGSGPAILRFRAADGHLGGTFVETPGRLGPYQTANGDLYFVMEPSETDNRFMAVKSSDFGQSWREVDGANRPDEGDLEGVATARVGDVIHILHQQSEEVFYHAFEMGVPGKWLVNSESIATPAEPPTQFADLVALSDGSLVALYGGAHKLFLQRRSVSGSWQAPQEIDVELAPDLSGPVLAVAPDDIVTLAYTGRDGSGFVRHLPPGGTLSTRVQFADNLGVTDSENGAMAPLVVVPETGETILVYRQADGYLYERRFHRNGTLSDVVQVTRQPVVTDAVDAEQVGADTIYHNGTLHVVYIDANDRDVYHVYSTRPGTWSQAERLIGDVDAGWVRGSVHFDAQGRVVYGMVIDTGSQGGSGFNRYLSLPLN
ncbi:exo-alpha-sialidase [Pseudohongiella spirulinae]|uniref:Exo-alpha-sialidase n=1 Tax=Pseudohongiella spirulinae TaxID=1249552 RepID=A0A0S2KCZ1_9GAMM|nr:exo-alpha-sialidase [Pseudohongiella spirulinae]ALO45956.1 hypothetical protein PS2015_1298 [Pseudohongiella spirulinae]